MPGRLKTTLVIFVLALFLSFYPAAAERLLTDESIHDILSAEKELLNARWESADSIYAGMIRKNPRSPLGYLYRAVMIQTRMTDRESDAGKERFFAFLDSTGIKAERFLDSCSGPDSAVCLLSLGHQNAYRAIFETRFGSKISAISYGMKAKGYYEQGLAADTGFYDLYLGLGSYHYWKSVKAGILRTFGFFSDERAKGIREIKWAVDSSLISKNAGKSALIWVLMNEKEYENAIGLAAEMHEQFPEGNFFLWPMAESYYKKKQYAQSAKIYKMLFERLKSNPGNYYNIIETVYRYYRSLEKIDRESEAEEALRFLNAEYDDIPRETKRDQKGNLAYLRRRFFID